MRKIGIVIIVFSIAMLSFFIVYNVVLKERTIKDVNQYIEETSVQEKTSLENFVQEEKTEEKKVINYTSVLEIPSIDLKQGLVDSTKNFNSINYSVSIDKNSIYPNQNGNFILYSHSGNSNIAFFNKLYKINLGDEIYIYYNGIKYVYKVVNKYDIEKTGKANVLITDTDKYITLITCNQHKKDKQIVIIGKIKSELAY